MTVPWFGPNTWQALLQPVPGGNIPVTPAALELKLTFKEGGAPDFHSNFERVKERLQHVVSAARENNLTGQINLENVHLDQLPSYQESGQDRMAPVQTDTTMQSPVAIASPAATTSTSPSSADPVPEQPRDAPPGYEETQQQSIQAELDRRFSQSPE
jgi:WW domain-binding protein 2